jgi:small conductance mechanosensitive channel
MKNWRSNLSRSLVLAAALLLWAGHTLANPEAADAAKAQKADSKLDASTETESASKELRARFDSLRENRLSRLREIDVLASDANSAIGDDQVALRAQALEFKLEGSGTIEDMWTVIEQMEAAEDDASAQRAVVAALLPGIRDSIRAEYTEQTRERDRLQTDLAEMTDADAIASAQSAIERKNDLLLRILAAGVDVTALSNALAISDRFQHDWIEARVLSRARLAMSHLRLASQLKEDVEVRRAAGGDPTALQAVEAAANGRYESTLENLKSVVALMERLELDSAEYQKILIESTGAVTVSAIDSDIAGELVARWASDLREGVADNGARIAFATFLFIVIVSIFWGLSRFVGKVVRHAVEAPHLRFSQLLKRMLVSLSTSSVLVIGLLIALSQLGIEVAPMLTGLGIAGFVLGFALQDTLGNFAAGVMVLLYRPYDVGDMIDCAAGVFGTVSHMSLVSTTILTIDNKTLIVPNSKIWGDVITNVSAQAIRRVDLEFGIGYGDDIPHAEEVLWSIIKDHPKVLEDPEPAVKVHSLGDSSVNFVVRPWVASDDYWDVYWDLTREVKLRFDREGVSIPFPQRDVHFYSTKSETEESAQDESLAP